MKKNESKKTIKTRKNNAFLKLTLSMAMFFTFILQTPVYAAESKNDKIQVSVTNVERFEPEQQFEFPGIWVAKNEITISSPLQVSRVREIYVDEGDIVKAGQPLLQLENSSLKTLVNSSEILLSQVKARIDEIDVRKKEADTMVKRVETLKKSKSISQQQYDEIVATAQSLAHQKEAIQAEASRVEQQLLDAKTQLNKSKVLAPVDGVISLRFVQEGELTNFSPLFRMFNNNELEFEAYVTQKALPQLKVGMTIDIISQGNKMPGEIRLVGTRIQPETGLAIIRVNPKMAFKGSIGSSGRAIATIKKSPINSIDTRAIRYDNNNPYVYVVNEKLCVIERPITLGARYIDKVEVTSGLDENDRVILSSAAFLKSGDCVKLETPEKESINIESKKQQRREKNRARQIG